MTFDEKVEKHQDSNRGNLQKPEKKPVKSWKSPKSLGKTSENRPLEPKSWEKPGKSSDKGGKSLEKPLKSTPGESRLPGRPVRVAELKYVRSPLPFSPLSFFAPFSPSSPSFFQHFLRFFMDYFVFFWIFLGFSIFSAFSRIFDFLIFF